jgi:nucleolar protein 4
LLEVIHIDANYSSTLFVSNLPYTATSVDLQTLFSDIAPVRSAFVVLDKETHKSKGVGYVSFAIKEDATSAVEHVKQKGIMMDKRSLRVQFADNKVG